MRWWLVLAAVLRGRVRRRRVLGAPARLAGSRQRLHGRTRSGPVPGYSVVTSGDFNRA